MPSERPPVLQAAKPSVASSDPLLGAAVAAVEPAYEAWRSAVAAAAEEIRGVLSRRGSPAGVASTLGSFAAGRIDLDRFAGLVERGEALDAAALGALERAASVLGAAATAPPSDQIVVQVPDGQSMRDVVGASVHRLGRAFGAARTAALAQEGRFRPEADGNLLEGLAPRSWSKRERRVAPPLVVSVAGADLDTASLVEVLDGGRKIVLLVRGPATPAPLVRLITPGVFVLQTSDATGLDAFAKAAGPAVAAIFPDAAAETAAFMHDPAAGPTLADRLVVRQLPKVAARSPVGPWSTAQQAQEVGQLAALAERSEANSDADPEAAAPAAVAPSPSGGRAASDSAAPTPAAVAAAAASDDPAGRLATWLLNAVRSPDART